MPRAHATMRFLSGEFLAPTASIFACIFSHTRGTARKWCGRAARSASGHRLEALGEPDRRPEHRVAVQREQLLGDVAQREVAHDVVAGPDVDDLDPPARAPT